MFHYFAIFFFIVGVIIIIYKKPRNKKWGEYLLENDKQHHQTFLKQSLTKKRKKKCTKKKKNKTNKPSKPAIPTNHCDELECPKPYSDNGNKNEQRCRKILEELFPGHKFPTVRPDWLKNPATKRNLELDMYCHELKLKDGRRVRLGVEYDGKQHYAMTKFHKNKTELLYQMKRDQYKKQKCKELGVYLFAVPHWANQDLKGYIINRLNELKFI